MLIYSVVVEMKKMLRNLEGWLDKGVAHAKAKGFEPGVLLESRLAPDMLPLLRQVQSACDQAKFASSRAAGKEPPAHPDDEKTMEDARKRIATVLAYLDTFGPSDFDGTDGRTVTLQRWEGKSMTATDFFVELALPNFFFHVTTAYAILRHNGVDVGKRDYLGPVNMR